MTAYSWLKNLIHPPKKFDDPKNWPRSKKNIVVFTIAYCAFVAPLASNIYMPAVLQVKTDLQTTSSFISATCKQIKIIISLCPFAGLVFISSIFLRCLTSHPPHTFMARTHADPREREKRKGVMNDTQPTNRLRDSIHDILKKEGSVTQNMTHRQTSTGKFSWNSPRPPTLKYCTSQIHPCALVDAQLYCYFPHTKCHYATTTALSILAHLPYTKQTVLSASGGGVYAGKKKNKIWISLYTPARDRKWPPNTKHPLSRFVFFFCMQ